MSLFRRNDEPTEQPDPVTSTEIEDPAQLRAEAERVRADMAEQVAAITSSAEQAAAELIGRAEMVEAERQEFERQHLYVSAVGDKREALAASVDAWNAARDELERAEAERDRTRSVMQRAHAEVAQARQELDRAAAAATDLDRIGDSRLALAKAEDVPRLLAPSVERAEATVGAATESVKWCAVVVKESHEALGRLGPEALQGIERPAALPKQPDPYKELARKAELMELAARDPQIRARRAREAARRATKPVAIPPGVDPTAWALAADNVRQGRV